MIQNVSGLQIATDAIQKNVQAAGMGKRSSSGRPQSSNEYDGNSASHSRPSSNPYPYTMPSPMKNRQIKKFADQVRIV